MAKRSYNRKAIDFRDLKGMEVKDKDEDVLGKVESVEIDPKTLKVNGIVVSRGMFKKGVLVGCEYIERVGRKYIWLNVDLTLLIEGKKVIDKDGEEVGKVIEVDRVKETNDLGGIRVKTDDGEEYVNAKKIKEINGSRVFLKCHI